MSEWRRWQMGALEIHDETQCNQRREKEHAEQRRAEAELASLRRQALEQAREEGFRQGFEAGQQAGHAEGLALGRSEGQQEYRDRTSTALAPLAELVQTFHEALQELDDQIIDELVELALETGRQLAGEALKARPRQVSNLVRKLLHEEPLLDGQPRLWLHPLDLKLVTEELGDEFEAAGWALQPDDQLARGGCRVSSGSGDLDATRESRWRSVLLQVRRSRSRRSSRDSTASGGRAA